MRKKLVFVLVISIVSLIMNTIPAFADTTASPTPYSIITVGTPNEIVDSADFVSADPNNHTVTLTTITFNAKVAPDASGSYQRILCFDSNGNTMPYGTVAFNESTDAGLLSSGCTITATFTYNYLNGPPAPVYAIKFELSTVNGIAGDYMTLLSATNSNGNTTTFPPPGSTTPPPSVDCSV